MCRGKSVLLEIIAWHMVHVAAILASFGRPSFCHCKERKISQLGSVLNDVKAEYRSPEKEKYWEGK